MTAIDGHGRGSIALSALADDRRATAVYSCDVAAGVREVFGDLARTRADADAAFDEFAGRLDGDVVENDHPLAVGLLAGSLSLCGPEAPPALRYWTERTAGREFGPRPFPAGFPGWDPSECPFGEMADRARDVLDACPDWLDGSPLIFELAEEIALREGDAPADPRRDSGAYRFFFERRLRGQLERYRRMLLWMAGFWRAEGGEKLARSALALAWQLSDAQHVVPGHPFAVALTTRSLAAARAARKRGPDRRTGRGR